MAALPYGLRGFSGSVFWGDHVVWRVNVYSAMGFANNVQPLRPSGTTNGVCATGSSMIMQRSPYTSSINPAVTISFGAPCATIFPSRSAIKWVA